MFVSALRRALVAGLAIAALTSCGASTPETASAGAPASGATDAISPPVIVGTVESIRSGSSDSQLIVTIGSIPPSGAGEECVSTIDIQPYPKPRELFLSISVTAGFDLSVCPLTGSRELIVEIGEPLAGRPISFNVTGSPQRFRPDGTGAFVECVLPACDPATKIDEPGTCANLRDFAGLADAPKNFDMVDVRCDEMFAVYGLDFGSGACAPGDGQPRACAGTRIDRMYWRSTPTGWTIIASNDDAGCGDVLQAVPDFPQGLCADLPAIG